MLDKIRKVLIFLIILLVFLETNVKAHGGNITGWKDRSSTEITEYNGQYYGYHKENGEKHFHRVEWDEENKRWKIINPAVYYDEKFDEINTIDDKENDKIKVEYYKSVDGDTAKFKLNDEIITVRFLGINTPETKSPTKGEEPYGKEASEYTKEKLEQANKVEIEYDKEAAKKDKYERVLAWVWVDDELLQESIVNNGLAETYMLPNNYKYAGTLQLAEEQAKNDKLGIWSENEYITTNENQEQMENIYYILALIVFFIITLLAGYKSKKKLIKKRK